MVLNDPNSENIGTKYRNRCEAGGGFQGKCLVIAAELSQVSQTMALLILAIAKKRDEESDEKKMNLFHGVMYDFTMIFLFRCG